MQKTTRLMTLALAAGLLASTAVYAGSDRFRAPTLKADADQTPQAVPGKVTNPSASFENGSTSGTITFTMPEGLNYASYPAVGWVKYRITEANQYPEVIYAEGDAQYGQTMNVSVELPAGYRTLIIKAVNEKGTGSSHYPYLSLWVGPGKPSNVTGATLAVEGTQASLSWNHVTTATRTDAFFLPAEVTYTVVRTPGDVTVAENLAATSFSETLPDTGTAVGYRYSVTAAFRGQTSDPVYSNGAPVGTSAAPWTADLTSVNDFLTFTVSPDNDSYIWQWDTFGRVKLPYKSFGSTPGNDDWLITPGLRLEGGKLYPVSFLFSSYGRSYTHTLEIKAGTTPDPEAMTLAVMDDAQFTTPTSSREDAAEPAGFLYVPQTGVYYVGLHDKSPVKVYDCYAYGFSIGEGIAGTAPETVTALSITSDVDVTPATAVITFNAPAVDIDGNALSALTDIKVWRGDLLVKTFAAPAPGAQLTFTDVLAPGEKGTYTYRIVASNASGAGRPLEQEAFVGDYRLHTPYSQTFETQADADAFTIIDVDGYSSSNKWTYESSYKQMSCNSSSSMDCDDWLILPAIWLKGGYRYTFSAEMKSYWAGDQVPFEVYLGTGNTVEAMTVMLGELKGADSNIGREWQTFTYNADPVTDGLYCFAIRYLGSGNSCKLCVKSVAVSDGLNVGEPAAITDLSAVPDFGGEAKVAVTFTAPSLSMSGATLPSLDRIELFRDDQLVNTFTNPAPGAALGFEDTGMEPGYHLYKVTPWGTSAGESSETRVFVGANIPAAPANAVVTEDASDLGKVTLSWEAPALDVDGAAINPALVRYNIYALSIYGEEPALLFESVEGTSHTFEAVPAGEQHFVWYRVKAVTAAGESGAGADTEVLAAGQPHALPFADSFADGTLSYEFNSERIAEYPAEWIVYSDRDFSNLVPQDADNGIIGMYAPYTMATSRLITGKIEISGAENPVASIWFRAVRDSQSKVAIEVLDCSAEAPAFTRLAEKTFWAEDYPEGWVKIEAPLTDYVGKTVQIGIVGQAQAQNYLFFDNLRVTQQYDHNLTALSISAPARMYPGEEADVTVRMQNYGAQTAEGYSVELYRNDELVQTYQGEPLAPDVATEVRFTELPDITMPEEFVYRAQIVYAADQLPADNTTAEVTVTHRLPFYPSVDDLAGTTEGGVNTLTWSEPFIPVFDCVPPEVTEDFESFAPFAKADLDDWKLVDGDGEPFGGFNEITFPGISGPVSYFVMDDSHESMPYDPNGDLKAHSGNKYLASGWVDGATGVSDDWLISPMVSVTSDRLSFWAKSYDASLLETFEVLYSTTDRRLDSFKRVRLCGSVPAEWTRYEFTLPAGTRYFAIRCISNDRFMLFIDDIAYTPIDCTEPMEVLGYNVYRDDVKVNDAMVTGTTYADAATEAGKACRYAVSTILDLGESRLSNEVQIVTSSIDPITGSGIDVRVVDNTILISGAEGLTAALYDTAGRLVATTVCTDPQAIPVPVGVALLTVGPNSYKLLVR